MSEPITFEQMQQLFQQQAAVITSANRGGGLQLPGISTFINGTTDSLIKLTAGTYGLQDAMALGAKTLEMFPMIGGTVGATLEKVGTAGIQYNNVLKDLSKSGFTFSLDIGKMVDAVNGARISLPQFQAMVKDTGLKLAGLAGDANRSGFAFLGLAKDVAESQVGRELRATGISAEELQRSLAITTSMRRGADLSTVDAQKEVVRSALEMTREMDNVARLTGISRQEQEKAVQAQMRKTENEIMLMAMDKDQREAYQKSTAALGAYGKDFQDVLTIFKTGGVRTAEDNAKVAALGPEFTRLVKELSDIEGNDEEANRRRQAIMAQMDAETLRIANDKEELKLRAMLVTAGGEFGAAQGRVTLGLKDLATALQTLERKPGETIEEARARAIEEYNKQREAALKGTLDPGAQTAALINRTEDLFKDISAGVGRAFKEGNDTIGDFAKANRDTINNVIVPLNQAYMSSYGSKLIEKLKGGEGGRGEDIRPEVVTNPEIANRPEVQSRERRELGSKGATGNWWELGPKNILMGEGNQSEAVVPFNQRADFITDIARSDPSVLAPLMQEMQSKLASAASESSNGIKDTISEIIKNIPTTVSSAGTTPAPAAGASTNITDPMSVQIDIAKGIESLNKLTAQLIDAVELTGISTTRAIKSKGNLIA